MAWRIDEHVVRGEIDNRTRGRVTGRIWFDGRKEPVELDLEGDAWRDMAGRRLEFVNPESTRPLEGNFATLQKGVVGDITASRKVKVPDVSMDEVMRLIDQGKPFPWHWGNSLYLEWFSEFNGRVMIESASFQLTVSPEAAWEMTPEEEEQQRRANGAAIVRFMERAGEALPTESIEADDGSDAELEPEAEATWSSDEDRPLTEAEADRMLADSDRLTDRITARMDREGEDADFERIMEEELERRRRERQTPPLTPEQEEERARWIEEMNAAAENADEDPELMEIVESKHPLAERASELSFRVFQEPDERGWITDRTHAEHPLVDLLNSTRRAAGKLAGALNGREWPPTVDSSGMAIAWLKRARGFLEDALAAADACREEQLVDAAWLHPIRAELGDIRTEVDALIADLRDRLERGFD